jgi:hypothetical protein
MQPTIFRQCADLVISCVGKVRRDLAVLALVVVLLLLGFTWPRVRWYFGLAHGFDYVLGSCDRNRGGGDVPALARTL